MSWIDAECSGEPQPSADVLASAGAIVPPFARRCLAVALLAMMVPMVSAQSPSPSATLYEEVSVARGRHSDVIWGGEAATPEALRAIVRELEADIAKLDEPLARELAEGNVYLRYRRYNLLCDLLRLYARLGDQDAALRAWSELMMFHWSAGESGFERARITESTPEPTIEALKRLPGYRDIAAQRRVAAWWSKAPSIATRYRDVLPLEERIAGVSLLWTNARNGFVWFDRVPDLDWDAAYREALTEAIAAPDIRSYYRVLMRFVARLQDGHSNVYFPEALKSEYARPGLTTRLIGDRVVVVAVRDLQLQAAGVRVGDELLAVDDVPVREHAERHVRPYVSASTPQDVAVRTYRYQLLMGDAAVPVKLRLAGVDGKPYDVVAPRTGYRAEPVQEQPLFRIREDGIAVLRAPQFEDDAALKAFMAAFAELSRAKGLVLDLRGNGGGSTSNGLRILAHLSRKPLPETHSLYLDVAPYLQTGGREPYIKWRNVDRGSGGKPPEQQYEGPVIMLIDARTFSAAEDTADVFRRMARGRILGMPSGGSSGQPFLFTLPGGGTARICVKRDMAPDGTTFVGKGVQPDLSIDDTQQDVRAGRDVVLERAVGELLQAASGH